MASTYLSRTLGTATNRKKFTFSAWMKRGSLSGDQAFFSTGNASDPITTFRWNSDGKIYLFYLSGSSMVWEFATNARYRDCNGWYNVVIAFDSTESSGGDRLKLWVNGEQVTSWSTQVNPSEDMTPTMNSAVRHDVGTNGSGGNIYNGLMSHVHFVDGTAYPASTFGSTDTTTGEWKINTSPSITMGTNGFTILKDGNTITDQSSNSNDFSLSAGTLTKTEDNPSNVFATVNPIGQYRTVSGRPTFSNGNNTIYFDNGSYNEICNSTLSLTSGNFYWETKIESGITDSYIGIYKSDDYTNGFTQANVHYLYMTNGQKRNGDTATSYGSSYTNGDIIGCAWNGTTGTIWFSKNGTWQNSATISEIGAGTTTNSAFTGLSSATDGNAWLTFNSDYNNGKHSLNFGNGYFGTTAVSSAGTNASGIGIFEYDVPTNYTALSTKGLNL